MIDLFKMQASCKEENKHFFNLIIKGKNIKRFKQRETFAQRGYKLYPSDFSFGMCVYEYLENIDNKTPPNVKGQFRMDAGSYLHAEYQEDLLLTSGLYPKPVLTDPKSIKKLNENWPEIPGYMYGISFRVDSVLCTPENKSKPLPTEIKSTNQPIEDWDDYIAQELPVKKHECQVHMYAYLLNALKIYDQKIDQVMLVYRNRLLLPEDPAGIVEFRLDHTPAIEKKCHELAMEGMKQRMYKILNKPSSCTYKACEKHRSRK